MSRQIKKVVHYIIFKSFYKSRKKGKSKSVRHVFMYFKKDKTAKKFVIWYNIILFCLFFVKRTKPRVDKFYLKVTLVSFLLLTFLEFLVIFVSPIIFCTTITITVLLLSLPCIHLIKVRVTWLLVSPFIRTGSSLQTWDMI
jgi:hypothetical protein